VSDDVPGLTTTSYAVLSLLSLRSWTTYELAQQMKRSVHWFWPRAESNLYEEPKKLVAHRFARASKRYTGKRASTVYTITPAGRRALAAWARQPGEPAPTIEFEALVRVLSAQCIAVEDLHQILEAVRDRAQEMIDFGEHQDTETADSGGPFPERAHIIALVHGFMALYSDALQRWAQWAMDETATWRDTAPDRRKLDRAHTILRTPVADFAARAGRTSKR